MDFESLESMDKSEFLPLGTVKQEMLDTSNGLAAGTADTIAESNNINSANTNDTPEPAEASNPVCDSAEKQGDADKSSANDESGYRKCVFCSQILGAKDVPKLMECLHVTCNACITAKFSEVDRSQPTVVLCPKCKTPSTPDGVILDQFLIELSEANGEESQTATDVDAKAIKCSSCTDDAPATSWCVECAEYICDSCVQAHQRLKITKDHTFKSKEEALADQSTTTSDEKMLMCHAHPQEKLSLFCETCDRLTCRDCQLVDHRDHKYKFANEIAAETRSSLDVLLNDITYKRVLLNSAMNVIDNRQKLIADKKKELVSEITNMVLRITNTVNMRGKQRVHRLSEVCDGKLKVLNEKKEALQLLSNHTDHCIDFVKLALDKGSDSAVLFSKKTLTTHLQKVKSQRADIPNPEIPVRIQVQMNQVQELQKVISQLGTIIVDGKTYPPNTSPSPGAVRQQPSPSNVNPIQPNIAPANLVAVQPPPMQAQPLQPAQRSAGMLPPSRSPQIPPSINLRNNLYSGTTPPVQQPANFQQQQSQPACNLSRSFPQDNQLANVPGFGRFPNMGPRPTQFRQMTPHVSSSTHPQLEISLRGLLTQGGANQTIGQVQHVGANEFSPLFNQPMAQQQGLPAQGMQMGHFPGMTSGQPQNSHLHQRRQQQQLQQQQQQQHIQQQQQQQQQNLQQQQQQQHQQQRHQMQDLLKQQMIQAQPNRAAIPSGYQQAGPAINQVDQRPMVQNNDIFFGQQMNFPPNNSPTITSVTNCASSPSSWHIPQSGRTATGGANNQPSPNPLSMQFCSNGRLNENSFKISLKPQNTLKQTTAQNQPATPVPVTSTNPKTPSPSTNDHSKEFSDSIDKACEASVNDLMATIAKLDSNGVQVLLEGQRGKTTSPQVSSTDYSLPVDADKMMNKDDPNEDWCAVCSDGGELMCCDKCPKVFHQHCHIPIINPFPDENEPWQCMLCYNFNDMPLEPVIGDKRSAGLSPAEHKRIQRILLELYCQNERSSMFRDLEPESNGPYYEIVKNAITLDIIRSRLDPTSPDGYRDVSSFIDDVRLLFSNVYLFYREDSKIYKNAKFLEKFFEEQLAKLLPDYVQKQISLNGNNQVHEAKRMRTENQRPTEIIDDGDDDVILA